MIRSQLGLKALGICALVFGLMAAWAGAAQAENTGGSWTYTNASEELKTFEGALAEPEIDGEMDAVVVLHTEALEGTKVLVECLELASPFGSRLKANGSMLGKIIFTKCMMFLNGVLVCKIRSETITTNLIKAQMLLHKLAGGTIDKILIAEGETEAGGAANLAVIETEGICALGTKIQIGGKFAMELSNPTTHEVKHLAKEFPALTHLWILSDTAEHKVNILGSGWAFLASSHATRKWAGLWK